MARRSDAFHTPWLATRVAIAGILVSITGIAHSLPWPAAGTSAMSYQPIENYGLIGNMRTAALVGMDGSIDWLCLPHFDSPTVFAAILDDQKGGRFRIAPTCHPVRPKQFYWPDTNILVTR